mgnify:CR=1 FL=1
MQRIIVIALLCSVLLSCCTLKGNGNHSGNVTTKNSGTNSTTATENHELNNNEQLNNNFSNGIWSSGGIVKVGSNIYFSKYDVINLIISGMYFYDLETGEYKKISEHNWEMMFIYNNRIYGIDAEAPHEYRSMSISLDGKDFKKETKESIDKAARDAGKENISIWYEESPELPEMMEISFPILKENGVLYFAYGEYQNTSDKDGSKLYISSGIAKYTYSTGQTEKMYEGSSSDHISQGDYIYFICSGIYRIKKDGTGLKKISEYGGLGNLNAYGGKIYNLRDEELVVMNPDGSNQTVVKDGGRCLTFWDDYIYYFRESDAYIKLCRRAVSNIQKEEILATTSRVG